MALATASRPPRPSQFSNFPCTDNLDARLSPPPQDPPVPYTKVKRSARSPNCHAVDKKNRSNPFFLPLLCLLSRGQASQRGSTLWRSNSAAAVEQPPSVSLLLRSQIHREERYQAYTSCSLCQRSSGQGPPACQGRLRCTYSIHRLPQPPVSPKVLCCFLWLHFVGPPSLGVLFLISHFLHPFQCPTSPHPPSVPPPPVSAFSPHPSPLLELAIRPCLAPSATACHPSPSSR